VHPNIFNQWKLKLEPDEGRKYPIALKENFIQKDTLYIQVPNGYELESLPKPQSIHSDFGEYSIEFIYQQQQIVMIRYQTSIKKSWPPSRYNDLMNFFNAMYQYDRGQVVLKKKYLV
ncbi:MAG: hypothetical protein KGK14_06675, partial [Bacteroidota bacterium]|nr:hypothetical protein [Bacteroidota bacterium]